jgi:hypothetical protein
VSTETHLGAGRGIEVADLAGHPYTSVHQLTTSDGAKVNGVLHDVPGATLVANIIHPRQDSTHHGLVGRLLAIGVAVWTQHVRSVNNDVDLLHEQALLDVAAGMAFLDDRYQTIVPIGHSGGGTLFAYYIEQAALPPSERITRAPGGRRVDLAAARMPIPAAVIFLAPHPGQGRLLMACIDPSVCIEGDPNSLVPSLSAFDPSNGFLEPPKSSGYSPDFAVAYREAQVSRIARIDDRARGLLENKAYRKQRHRATQDVEDWRASLAPLILTTYRTDADLRCVDLSLDPNERPYGSVFGRRPDLTNYGLVGFGRLATAEAWLSTWSGLSSRADFVRCAPAVTMPTLFIELTGDQAAFPSDCDAMMAALGAQELDRVQVRGTHFGGPIGKGARPGFDQAVADIDRWLSRRFPRARAV